MTSEPTVDIEIRFSIARREVLPGHTDEKLAQLLLEDMKDEFSPEIRNGVMQISLRGINEGTME